ncbi:hypothetical protein GW17_00043650 [Ensete ventricosum]|nr:hypothetical protein GW17_00043650 [Ensete ventricosum]
MRLSLGIPDWVVLRFQHFQRRRLLMTSLLGRNLDMRGFKALDHQVPTMNCYGIVTRRRTIHTFECRKVLSVSVKLF